MEEGDRPGAAADLHQTAAYDYTLPPGRVALHPASPRHSALLLDATGASCCDRRVMDLPSLLRGEDVVVVNDVRVTPVRVALTRVSTGGQVEGFMLGVGGEGLWQEDAGAPWIALLRSGGRLAAGEVLAHASGVRFRLDARDAEGVSRLFPVETLHDPLRWLDQNAALPLPPYIERERARSGAPALSDADLRDYQTWFASRPGAVAAPTASLHFDEVLVAAMAERGIRIHPLTLWVGMGTFRPVSADDLRRHTMHAERYEIPASTIEAIAAAKRSGGRVLAVGTTVVRALEASALGSNVAGMPTVGAGSTDLFITPGFPFRVVDLMLTNFHLPRSTLLAMVSAFAGYERVRQAYAHALAGTYRFFSYGDAMLLGRA